MVKDRSRVIQTLKTQLSSLVNPDALSTLSAGDTIPSVILRTVEDSLFYLTRSVVEKGRVIVLVSTTCPACEQSMVFMKDIVSRSRRGGFDSFFISVHAKERTEIFRERHDIESLVLVGSDSLSRSRLKANVVPQIILVGPQGVIRFNWVGIIDSVKYVAVIDSLQIEKEMSL